MDKPSPDKEAKPISTDGKAASEPARDGSTFAGDTVRFDAVHLKIGAPVHLQPTYESERLLGTLIGCIRGVSVLVHIARLPAKSFALEDGQPLIVRMFSETSAYAFKAEILQRCLRPALYLHLRLPDEVQRASVRNGQRIKVQIPAAITLAADGSQIDAMIVDLSVAGARFEAAGSAIAKGDVLRVAFRTRLGADEAMFSCDAQVRSISVVANAARMQFGIEFSSLKLNDRLLLMGMIYIGMTSTLQV
jgi:c-di-GMP-binding flagellar brake protein YcgR